MQRFADSLAVKLREEARRAESSTAAFRCCCLSRCRRPVLLPLQQRRQRRSRSGEPTSVPPSGLRGPGLRVLGPGSRVFSLRLLPGGSSAMSSERRCALGSLWYLWLLDARAGLHSFVWARSAAFSAMQDTAVTSPVMRKHFCCAAKRLSGQTDAVHHQQHCPGWKLH